MQFDIKSALAANWPIKITALALAAVLWAALSAVQPTAQFVPVRLDIQIPDNRILAQELPQVQAVVSGPPRELIKLYTNPPVLTKVVPDSATGSTVIIDLSPQDVILQPDEKVTLQDIVPRRLVVYLDDVRRRSVPVYAPGIIRAASGFVLLGGRVSVVPESVVVLGPAAQVNRIGRLYTIPLDLPAVRSTIRRSVPIDTTALGVVTLSQPQVEIEVRVDQITQRIIGGVPVVIGGGVWGSVPSTVQVTVRGPAARLLTLNRDSLLVTAPAAAAEGDKLALSVRSPTGLTATVAPDSVQAQRIIR